MNALAELISRAGCAYADRIAVASEAQSLTFAEVESNSNRLASALTLVFGLRKGDRVAVLLSNCNEFVISDFALIKAALVRVPVNPRCTSREVAFVLQHSGAAAIIVDSAHANLLAAVGEALPALRTVVLVGPSREIEGAHSWRDALAQGDPRLFAIDTIAGDWYMLAYTSGTTGRPKGVLTDVRARWAALFNVFANELYVSPSDVMLHATSLAHGGGTKLLPFFIKGAKNVLMRRFSPDAFFAMVEHERATTSWMVPTMIAMLADARDKANFDLSSLCTIIYAGAPMPAPLLKRALDTFGPIFVQVYGLTEAPHPVLVLTKEDHMADCIRLASGSPPAGREAVGARVKIVDEANIEMAPGETGELAVSGEHILTCYWNDPVATAETLRDGWCHTGDLARRDASGFHYIVGRKKEMIISGGYNVYPREIEDVLYELPQVDGCAVVGDPDPLWGETVHAFVRLKPGTTLDAEAILAHCASELAGYKKPRRISFVERLPMTPAGKLDRKALQTTPAAAMHDATRELR